MMSLARPCVSATSTLDCAAAAMASAMSVAIGLALK